MPGRHGEIELCPIPGGAGSDARVGHARGVPISIRGSGQVPAHAFTEEAAIVRHTAQLVGDVLAAAVALDFPLNRHGKGFGGVFGKRGGNHASRFLVGIVRIEIPVMGVVTDHDGDHVLCSRAQRRRHCECCNTGGRRAR